MSTPLMFISRVPAESKFQLIFWLHQLSVDPGLTDGSLRVLRESVLEYEAERASPDAMIAFCQQSYALPDPR